MKHNSNESCCTNKNFFAGYLLQAENKLKSLSVSIRLKKPDPEIESVKNYGKQLETNLGNFLYTRYNKLYIYIKLVSICNVKIKTF